MVVAEHVCWRNEHKGTCCSGAGQIPGVTGRKGPTSQGCSSVKTCSQADSGWWNWTHPPLHALLCPLLFLLSTHSGLHTGCLQQCREKTRAVRWQHSWSLPCRQEGRHPVVNYPCWAFITAVVLSLSGRSGLTWVPLGSESPVGWFPPPCPSVLPLDGREHAPSAWTLNLHASPVVPSYSLGLFMNWNYYLIMFPTCWFLFSSAFLSSLCFSVKSSLVLDYRYPRWTLTNLALSMSSLVKMNV